jgi:hypothetical protein
MSPDYTRKTTFLFAICVALCCSLLLFVTLPAIGLTWDEPAYMQAASPTTNGSAAYGMSRH